MFIHAETAWTTCFSLCSDNTYSQATTKIRKCMCELHLVRDHLHEVIYSDNKVL